MCRPRTAIVDAAFSAVFEEPEIDAYDIAHVDKVTALLSIGDAVRATKKACLARLFDLMVELIENRRHLALVVLLWPIDIKVFQPDNRAACLRNDLAHIAIECEF